MNMNRLDHEMQSSLLSNDEFVVESPQPATYSHPVVVVIAPESLSEGYTFDVEVNREILTVMVVSYPPRYSSFIYFMDLI